MQLHLNATEMTGDSVSATLQTSFISLLVTSPLKRTLQAVNNSSTNPKTLDGCQLEPSDNASHVVSAGDNQEHWKKKPRLVNDDTNEQETDAMKYRCQYPGCDKAYRKKNKLDEHIRSHTGERPFVCAVEGCGKAYMRSTHLAVHARSHDASAGKPHQCTYNGCTSSFSTRQHLLRHQTVHEMPLSFVCNWEGCDAAFAKRYQLRNHICTHTNKKPYPCTWDDCESSFNSLHQLQKHESTVHAKEKRYMCGHEGCGAQFLKWSQLQYHCNHDHEIRCAMCDKTFMKRHYLTQHIKAKHVEQEPVGCHWEGCEKTFSSRKSLNVHIRAFHENIKSHKCPHEGCELAFSHQSLLRRHCSTRHAPKKVKTDTSSVHISVLTGYKENANAETRGYVCPIDGCETSYWREYDLKRHLKSKSHEKDIYQQIVNNNIV